MIKVLREIFIILMFIFAGFSENSHAEFSTTEEYDEYLVKAAFLYNFAKFIEWSNEELPKVNSPLALCIVGEDPFGEALETINGKEAGGRKLVVKGTKQVGALMGCDIVFISASEKKNLVQILARIQVRNILTVGDMPGFAKSGGIINFTKVNHKIHFEINLHAAQQAGLKFSSEVLDLAKIVQDENVKGMD